MQEASSYSPANPYSVKGARIRIELIDLVGSHVKRILSVGCGTCATEALLKEKGIEVWGLDIVPESAAIGASRIDRVIVGDIEADALNEIPQKYFDLVVCGDVLEHLRFPEHALRKISEWIVPEGEVIISVPNFSHYSVLIELGLRRTFTYRGGGIQDRGHYRIFTRINLTRMVQEAGFSVLQTTFLRPIERRLGFAAPIMRAATRVAPILNDYLVQTWMIRARACR